MKLLYISGTRADYGKLKPLIIQTLKQNDYEVLLLVGHVKAIVLNFELDCSC